MTQFSNSMDMLLLPPFCPHALDHMKTQVPAHAATKAATAIAATRAPATAAPTTTITPATRPPATTLPSATTTPATTPATAMSTMALRSQRSREIADEVQSFMAQAIYLKWGGGRIS
eukprot:CAMPEP_0179455272 /NCGR_PEP_ID=MMETSP0799-20121207/39262_1 /TAXON_ID=46947 /ORGANISM="Geminigera cryophila, Strain CCMP2564" /LENGTH=116 /DNA_ID=CAMNT_0021254237 /DNA_START=383 /DNA_END=730 /DNA_ORIENTATION=+